MKSPFPGMDPYLEKHWLDVHSTFITFCKSALNRVLPPDLVSRSEERLAIDALEWSDAHGLRPDVRVFKPGIATEDSGGIALEAPFKLVLDLEPATESFIRIITPSDERVVTVIELVSPCTSISQAAPILIPLPPPRPPAGRPRSAPRRR